MNKNNHVRGLLLTALVFLSGCGGSGGSGNPNNSTVPDSVFEQVPGLGDLGDVGDFGDLGDLSDLVDTGDLGDFANGTQTPSVRTLQWPGDFPADIRAGLTDTILVNGLQTKTAYDFDVTLPPSVDSDDTVLFVMNLSDDQQVGGQVCTGEPDCTGTVIYNTVSLQLVSFDSGAATISIQPSSEPALINEGSVGNPVQLTLSGDQLSYNGSIGAATQTQQQVISGQSFYRLNGLMAGSRYEVSLANQTDDDVELAVSYTSGVEAQCDPSYSGDSRCVLVANSGALDLQVEGAHVLFGAGFTIDVNKVADASDFEGTWHTPFELQVPDEGVSYHLGHSDRYSSFYSLTGLDPERRYRILLSGNTTPVRLKLNSPITSLPVSSPQCRAVDEDDSIGEQVCIIESAIYTYFRVESDDLPSSYLLSVEVSPQDEATQAAPVPLQLDAQSKVLHEGFVISSSHYDVEGLMPGTQYMAQVHSASSRPQIALSSSADAAVNCDKSERAYCIFTAAETGVRIAVTDTGSEFGESFILSVLPIDPTDTRSPAPAAEDIQLAAASLPYTGTVDDFYSNYTVTGLIPDQKYLVKVSQNSEAFDLFAWPGQATTIDCRVTVRQISGSGCQTQADSNGVVNVRIGGDAGGQFRLDVLHTAAAADYVSNDTPLQIPDNSVPGAISTITVDDDSPVAIVEVVLQIEHRYTGDLAISLQTPDGRLVELADHVPGMYFTDTVYSDFAALPNPTGNSFTSHAFRTYRPEVELHSLGESSRLGDWVLHVSDDVYTNRSDAIGGTLLGWGLRFRELPE